ncbi:MAG: response regulator [Gemmatimonadetes bacterium]|nr:response regulator [Gemmatimonadota bacterium]
MFETTPPDRVPTIEAAKDLRRWRGVFAAVVLLTSVVLVSGFLANQAAVRRVAQSGTVIRHASEAQRALWLEESALRGFGLRRDTAAAPRARAARSVAETHLGMLRAAAGHEQVPLVDSLIDAVAAWHVDFADAVLVTGSVTRDVAVAATDRFDEVSRLFDAFHTDAFSRSGVLRLRQARMDWSAFALILVTIGVAAWIFRGVALALEREVGRAHEQARQVEAQSAELQQQALVLEEQTGQLEETTAELEHRIDAADEANRRLEETTVFLDSAVASAPFGVAFLGSDLRLLRVNPAIAALSARPVEAHPGLTLTDLMPVLGPRLEPVLSRVLRTGVAESDVVVSGEVPASPNTPRRWNVTCYPLRPRGRPPTGVGVMLLDVSARSQLEEQLRQAQKMEAVGRLAGGIAHDFNNVLTVIQSYGEMLAANLDPSAPGHEEIEAIRGAADRAATLARKLLAFSRREVVVPRVVDVNEVVSGIEGILRRLLRQGVDLEIRLADEALLVRCDAGQLEQVIMNLSINAVDAMPRGGLLTIVLSGGDERLDAAATVTHPAVVVSVRDTGSGMSAEVQRLLFEPFFTTKPSGQGTGLGLATGYAIVRTAGGTIRVRSAENEGSVFDIILPRVGDSEREPESRLSPSRGTVLPEGGETILLVEDEPAIRSALSRMLRSGGYQVVEAANGGEALRLAEETAGAIDLLLTDVMMPGIGGKELVQRVLAIRPGTRVILMSGYTDDEDLRRDLGAARYVFLQKPFTAKKVAATVRALLDAD